MRDHLKELVERYPDLAGCEADIREAYRLLREAYCSGHKVLACGNGGSCADSEHIVGELMKGFMSHRPLPEDARAILREADPVIGEELARNLEGSLRAIALTGHDSLSTAYINDRDAKYVYAQQVWGYGDPGDVLIAISTSGNSANVIAAAVCARARGLKVLLLSGETGGKLLPYADVAVRVPYHTSYEVQERHLPVYHALCLQLEEELFS